MSGNITLKNSDSFKPQKNIEAYLYNELNIEIYNDLTEPTGRKGLFEPLAFLNLLYAELEFFHNNADRYLTIKNHFGKLSLKGEKRYYFLWALKELIEKVFPTDLYNTGVIYQSCEYVEGLYIQIKNELYPAEETPEVPNKYDLKQVKQHLETLQDNKAKIKYLTEIKTEYQQNRSNWEVEFGVPRFDEQCSFEIKKLKEFLALDSTSTKKVIPVIQPKAKVPFALSKSFSKIDYIRIINALSELRCLQKEDETYPTKQDVMKAFGDLVGIDLSNYTNDLNKAFNTNVTIEQNVEIFEKLKSKTQELYQNRQNKPKK